MTEQTKIVSNPAAKAKENDTDEIDLLELFYIVKRKLWLVILVAIIFAGAFGCYNYFFVKQLYQSTATIFVMDRNQEVTMNELNLGKGICGDYTLIIKGSKVANRVINELGLNMTYTELQNMVTVANPTDTHALTITVKATSPEEAVSIVNEVMYASIKEIRDVLDITEPSIMDQGAEEFVQPVGKKLIRNSMIGGLLGAFLVIAILIIKEMMNTTIATEEDVEKHLSLPTLSNIPLQEVSENREEKKLLFEKVHGKNYIWPLGYKISFDTTESLTTLRTNMLLSGYSKRVFLLTSVTSNEGKSFISYHLARNIAEMGKKTLLIDCDTRNSELCRKLEIKKKLPGVTEYLCGLVELKDVIFGTDMECLDIIMTGDMAPNPTDLFESEQFSQLINKMRLMYDYVIVDAAPLGLVIDAAVIAKSCDSSLLVLEAGKNDYRVADRVKRQLEVTGINIAGVVINKFNQNKNSYYGRYGYGKKYGYGYGYGYGERNKEDAE